MSALLFPVSCFLSTYTCRLFSQAKILRMSHDAQGAIRVLQNGLQPERSHTFAQADTLVRVIVKTARHVLTEFDSWFLNLLGPFFHSNDIRRQRTCSSGLQNLIAGAYLFRLIYPYSLHLELYRSHATYHFIAAGQWILSYYLLFH